MEVKIYQGAMRLEDGLDVLFQEKKEI